MYPTCVKSADSISYLNNLIWKSPIVPTRTRITYTAKTLPGHKTFQLERCGRAAPPPPTICGRRRQLLLIGAPPPPTICGRRRQLLLIGAPPPPTICGRRRQLLLIGA